MTLLVLWEKLCCDAAPAGSSGTGHRKQLLVEPCSCQEEGRPRWPHTAPFAHLQCLRSCLGPIASSSGDLKFPMPLVPTAVASESLLLRQFNSLTSTSVAGLEAEKSVSDWHTAPGSVVAACQPGLQAVSASRLLAEASRALSEPASVRSRAEAQPLAAVRCRGRPGLSTCHQPSIMNLPGAQKTTSSGYLDLAASSTIQVSVLLTSHCSLHCDSCCGC